MDGDTPAYQRTAVDPSETAEQDRAYAALTDAVRGLCDAQLRTTLAAAETDDLTARIRQITKKLLTQAQAGPLGITIDTDGNTRNHGNSVVGLRNPFAAAVGEGKIVWSDEGASTSMHLNGLYEGPPGMVHGGVIALVLDQVFGEAAAAAGTPGMTGTLTLRYLRPTPLGQISAAAWRESSQDYKTVIRGHMKDAEGNITVEAEGLFILPRWARDRVGEWPFRPVFE